MLDSSSFASVSPLPKKFRFSASPNEIFLIPRIDNLTAEEVKATWYERSDYEKMKMAMVPLIRKMMKGETIEETDQETIRGLEFRTRQGAIRRQHNKVEAITAVMDEQDRQIEDLGAIDEYLLSLVYCEINAPRRQAAHELALGDVEPARKHCSDAMELIRRQYKDTNEPRLLPGRKPSIGKLMKHMLLGRRPTLVPGRLPNEVVSIAGSAA